MQFKESSSASSKLLGELGSAGSKAWRVQRRWDCGNVERECTCITIAWWILAVATIIVFGVTVAGPSFVATAEPDGNAWCTNVTLIQEQLRPGTEPMTVHHGIYFSLGRPLLAPPSSYTSDGHAVVDFPGVPSETTQLVHATDAAAGIAIVLQVLIFVVVPVAWLAADKDAPSTHCLGRPLLLGLIMILAAAELVLAILAAVRTSSLAGSVCDPVCSGPECCNLLQNAACDDVCVTVSDDDDDGGHSVYCEPVAGTLQANWRAFLLAAHLHAVWIVTLTLLCAFRGCGKQCQLRGPPYACCKGGSGGGGDGDSSSSSTSYDNSNSGGGFDSGGGHHHHHY